MSFQNADIELQNEKLMTVLDEIRDALDKENAAFQETHQRSSLDDEVVEFEDTFEITTKSDSGEKNIEYLDLSEWTHLSQIPESVFRLFTLESLHLQKCASLMTIPSSIKKLTKLTEIDLSRCTSLKYIPDEIFSSLPQLKRLSLAYCSGLEYLPEDWKGMANLTSLYLEGCCNLQKLPDGLWLNCKKLVYLGLVKLKCFDHLPQGLGNLTKLKTLNIRGCGNLKTLSIEPSVTFGPLKEIHSIFATDTPILDLPMDTLASLKNLQIISLEDCPNIPDKLKDKKVNVMNRIRLLVNTRDQAAMLELILWKLWGWSEDPMVRARNRLHGAGIDTVIQGVIPFLCGFDDAHLFSFCFGKLKR